MMSLLCPRSNLSAAAYAIATNAAAANAEDVGAAEDDWEQVAKVTNSFLRWTLELCLGTKLKAQNTGHLV